VAGAPWNQVRLNRHHKSSKQTKKGDLKTKPDPVRRCTLENDEETIRPFYMLRMCK